MYHLRRKGRNKALSVFTFQIPELEGNWLDYTDGSWMDLRNVDLSKIQPADLQALCPRCRHYGCGLQAILVPCYRWHESRHRAEWQLGPAFHPPNKRCPCFENVFAADV